MPHLVEAATSIRKNAVYCASYTISYFLEKLSAKMEDQLGFMNSELDGRFSTVRTKESNLGMITNFHQRK